MNNELNKTTASDETVEEKLGLKAITMQQDERDHYNRLPSETQEWYNKILVQRDVVAQIVNLIAEYGYSVSDGEGICQAVTQHFKRQSVQKWSL